MSGWIIAETQFIIRTNEAVTSDIGKKKKKKVINSLWEKKYLEQNKQNKMENRFNSAKMTCLSTVVLILPLYK